MSKIKEELQITSIKALLTMFITALVTMLVTIWLSIQDPLAKILIDNVPKSVLLVLPIVLLLILLLAVAYIIYLHKKIKNPIEDFEFDEKIGILRNPKDSLTYCTSCLHKGIKSPLKVQENGWMCLNKECHSFYSNPDYNAPAYKPIQRSRSNWIDDW